MLKFTIISCTDITEGAGKVLSAVLLIVQGELNKI